MERVRRLLGLERKERPILPVPKESIFYQQQLLVMGFLGGISFAALVTVIQAQKIFEPASLGTHAEADLYFRILITLLGLTSAFFVFASVIMTQMAGGIIRIGGAADFVAAFCASMGIVGFMVGLPLLIVPFSHVGWRLVAVIEVVMFLVSATVVGYGRRKEGIERKRRTAHQVAQERQDTEP